MNIAYRTKGNAPVNGKQVIFLHAMQEDSALREEVIDLILQDEDAHRFVIVYLTDTDFPVDFDTPELSRTNLYLPLVTPAYLKQCPSSFDWELLQSERGIKVLPVVQDAQLIPSYDRRFHNQHAVTLSMLDPAHEIAQQLGRMLVDTEMIAKIVRDAFTRLLFISYRKKDRAQIVDIMRSVRGTRWGTATSFWFDDFLVPGTDFEEGIGEALQTSDAVVLAVTPNLPLPNDEGGPNYVCAHEYPDARALGKTVIAVESQPTSRASLTEALGEDFPACVPMDDQAAMDHAFSALGPAEQEADPQIAYLRAMAFLNGIRVERDPQRALSMLADCVEAGVPEAAYQLAYLYAYGLDVPMDVEQATTYLQKAYHIVKAWPEGPERLEWMHKILFSSKDELNTAIGLTSAEADEYYQDFLDDATRALREGNPSPELEDKLKLWRVEAHALLGSVENRSPIEVGSRGYEYFADHLRSADAILMNVKDQSVQRKRIGARLCSIESSYYRRVGDLDEAQRDADYAYSLQRQVVEEEPSYQARWELVTYQVNCLGCRVLRFQRNRPTSSKLDPDNVSWSALREEAVNSLASEISYEAFDNAAADLSTSLENLYAEKKHPILAYDLMEVLQNSMLFAANPSEKQHRRSAALERGEQLCQDYPSYQPLQDLYHELQQTNSPTTLRDMRDEPTPPPTRTVQGLFLYILACMVIGAIAEHVIGWSIAFIETIWILVGGLQIFAEIKSPWRLLGGVVIGFVLMAALRHVALTMLGLPSLIVTIVCFVIAIVSVVA